MALLVARVQPHLFQIQFALDAPERLIVDLVAVAQVDDGTALDVEQIAAHLPVGAEPVLRHRFATLSLHKRHGSLNVWTHRRPMLIVYGPTDGPPT